MGHLPELWESLVWLQVELIILLTIWSALSTTVVEERIRIMLTSAYDLARELMPECVPLHVRVQQPETAAACKTIGPLPGSGFG